MRGTDSKLEGMFSCISPEARVPAKASAAADPRDDLRVLVQMDKKLEKLYSQTGQTIDSTGAADSGSAAAAAVLHPQRAAARGRYCAGALRGDRGARPDSGSVER